MAKDVGKRCRSNADWWMRMSPEARATYFHKHPKTKMRKVAGTKKPLSIAGLLQLQDERIRKRKAKWRASKDPFDRG